MDGGVNLDQQQISHWRDDLLANSHSIQSTTAVVDWFSPNFPAPIWPTP